MRIASKHVAEAPSVAPSHERRPVDEGALREGEWRMNSYAAFAPRLVEKLGRGKDADVQAYVLANRLNLQEQHLGVAGQLLAMGDQKVATQLAALHPDALAELFARGGPTSSELEKLPALIEASYATRGRYESYSRVAQVFGGPDQFKAVQAAAAQIGAVAQAGPAQHAPIAPDALWK
ncbi:MAG: hypothetical protein JNK82_25020 [Myxococcaceae bacterium]|nr:hypothetical protein [Myxococcaceae bacterium]